MRGVGVGVVAFLFAAAAAPLRAATFVVTTTADSDDGACDAACSLREAIVAANAAPGADRVVLPSGTYALARAGAREDAGASGDLDVTDDLVIAGDGVAATAIDAARLDRAIQVINAHLELADLTVRHGAATNGQDGGGVSAVGATLTLSRVEIAANTADGSGGGVYAGASTVTVVDSTLAGNRAAHSGGGLYFQGFTRQLAMRNATVSGNRAADAGGVFVDLECGFDAPCSLTSSTIADNRGSAGVGGLRCIAPRGSLTLTDTLLASNAGGNCAPGSALSNGHNLSDDGTCGLSGPGDRADQPGGAGPLRWNGGPTRTHALLDGSAAIDAGDPMTCPPADQRGRARQGRCDIGAFEASDGTCGDGFVDRGEACDHGPAAGDDCCLTTCAPAPAGTPCADDGDLCSRDACDAGTAGCAHRAVPAPTCRRAAHSLLAVRADGSVSWSWLRGAATATADLGEPQSAGGAVYALCAYAGATADELLRLDLPPSPQRWRSTSTGSLRYRDAVGPGDCARKLLLRPGAEGRARLQLTASDAPAPGLGTVATPIVVQLFNDDPGACWESRFTAEDVRRNDAQQLRAVALE